MTKRHKNIQLDIGDIILYEDVIGYVLEKKLDKVRIKFLKNVYPDWQKLPFSGKIMFRSSDTEYMFFNEEIVLAASKVYKIK